MDRHILDRLYNAVSEATAPPMSKQESLDILEELATQIEGMIDALKDEIAADEE